MKLSLLILAMLLPSWGIAKSTDNTALLKQVDYAELEKIIHKKLIADVKVTNHVYQLVDGEHTHHAIQGCTKTVKHSHKARKGHYHRYSCRGVRHYTRRAVPVRALQGKAKASSTNVQEQGVDEADLIKTDGRYLYAIQPYGNAGVRIYDTQYKGKQLKQIAAIGFGKNNYATGIYLLAGQKKLIVIGGGSGGRWRSRVQQASITTVDISNPKNPKTIKQIFVDGSIKSTRRINNMLYLVLNKGFNFPSTTKTIETSKPLSKAAIENERQKIITEIKNWRLKNQLPVYRQQGKVGTHTVIKNGALYYNPANLDSYGMTAILAVNLATPKTDIKGMGWMGNDYGIDYFSQKALYITSTDYRNIQANSRYPSNAQKTLIHKFSYHNNGFDYRGSGHVLGQFGWQRNSSFRLDEDTRGNLRVVSNNSRADYFRKKKVANPVLKSPVILTTLAEHPHKKELMILDNLPNKRYPKALGKPREQLYGARIFSDYAYFVTFRQTDPLYVVDLRQPRHLKMVGELLIPGFSEYLHPLGKGLLLGVGKDAETLKNGFTQTKGIKLSLFDIRNPRQPKEIHKTVIGGDWSQSEATRNHHAFTYLKLNNRITRVAIPIQAYNSKPPYQSEKALYRFEIDRIQRKIKNLGHMKALNNKRWSPNDRSIMIGDRLYYYHNGQFTAGKWKD